MEARPKVEYTITWDCTFILDGKTEEVTFLTDDIETVFAEYLKMKKQYKSCVWLKHEIHTKGRLLLSDEMMGLPLEEVKPLEPIIDAERPLRGNIQRVRNAAARGGIRDMRADEGWMGQHNADIARNMLKEPPQDKV